MNSNLMTPGVYIDEKNAYPNSAVAVETAVPIFIGYTEKAEFNGKSLKNIPTRITSFAEYVARFGDAFKSKFDIVPFDGNSDAHNVILIGDKKWQVSNQSTLPLFYNSIRL